MPIEIIYNHVDIKSAMLYNCAIAYTTNNKCCLHVIVIRHTNYF